MIIWNSVRRTYKTAIRGVFQFTRSITSDRPAPPVRDDGESLFSTINLNTLGRFSFIMSIAQPGILSEIASSGVKSAINPNPVGVMSRIE